MRKVWVRLVVAALAVGVALIAGSAIGQSTGGIYVIRGSNYTVIDSIYSPTGTISHSWYKNGTTLISLVGSISDNGVVRDTINLQGIRADEFRVSVQYKTTGGTGSDTALTVRVRSLEAGREGSVGHNDITSAEYVITPDSMKTGWWGGHQTFRRSAFWKHAVVISTNTDRTAVDSLRVFVSSTHPVTR